MFCCEDWLDPKWKKPVNTTQAPPPPPPTRDIQHKTGDLPPPQTSHPHSNAETNTPTQPETVIPSEPLKDNFWKEPTPEWIQAKENATSLDYFQAAIADGIADRPNGLFPSEDPYLMELSKDANAYPFEKHSLNADGRWEAVKVSMASGDHACQAGIDLRCFIKGNKLMGVIRYGDAAAIGKAFWVPNHGGSCETVLHECCIEFLRMTRHPFARATRATFGLLEPVPQHETLLVTVTVKPVTGGKPGEVTATMVNPSRSSRPIANCTMYVNVPLQGNAKLPDLPQRSIGQIPGGVKDPQPAPQYRWESRPPEVIKGISLASPEEYMRLSTALGIPPRPQGLIPDDDPSLVKFMSDPDLKAFQKRTVGIEGTLELIDDGWINNGPAAGERGLDLRLFYNKVKDKVVGLIRFSNNSGQGPGYPAHEGALESTLDETTAELIKIRYASVPATSVFDIILKAPAPINETLELSVELSKQLEGGRYEVTGIIQDTQGSTVYATCMARLSDIGYLYRKMQANK